MPAFLKPIDAKSPCGGAATIDWVSSTRSPSCGGSADGRTSSSTAKSRLIPPRSRCATLIWSVPFGERGAQQLMAVLPGIRAGNALVVSRCALIESLEDVGEVGCGRPYSEAITLKPGEMRVVFDGAVGLAARMLELAHVMRNDWMAVERRDQERHLPTNPAPASQDLTP